MWKENIKIDLEKMLEVSNTYYTEYRLSTSIAREMMAADRLMTCLIKTNITNITNTVAQEECGQWRT